MNKFFRALIAGYGAKKLGGGCFSTIIIFFVIYYLLGTCNQPAAQHTGMHAPAGTGSSIAATPPHFKMVNISATLFAATIQ